MRAVARHLIDGLRPPPERLRPAGTSLEGDLEQVARLMLEAALSPRALALQRLVVAESLRFPELAAAVVQAGGREEGAALVVALLRRYPQTSVMAEDDAQFAAHQFLQMVVSLPQLRAMGLGKPLAPAAIEDWVRRTVTLFLDGCAGPGPQGRTQGTS